MLNLQNGCLGVWWLFLNDKLDSCAIIKASFHWGHWLSKHLKTIEFTH